MTGLSEQVKRNPIGNGLDDVRSTFKSVCTREKTPYSTDSVDQLGQEETPLVIKDSWQYPERDEEGDLLREVTDKGIIPPNKMVKDDPRKGRPGSSKKRPSSQLDSALPSSKRSCSMSPTKVPSTAQSVREPREGSSGAKGKTGTRAFKAIGALLGEQHSFMHDLESFFWVLFWICIHYDADGKDVGLTGFDRWNYESDDTLAEVKMGVVADEQYFQQKITESFTAQYQPLVPWDTKL
ncbi:hypothetical protein CABS03_15045 [Colletotrichum abscissum]